VDYDESADMVMLGGSIYEGSGPWAARTAATAFQGNTVSKKLDWFKYKFTDDRLEGIDELDEHTQAVKKHMAAVYQRGNFYDTQAQFTLDGWTIGSPLTFLEEDSETGFLMSIPVHFKTFRIFYDRYNRSEGVIIKDEQWTAKKCFDKFCPGNSIEQRLEKAKDIFAQGLYRAILQGQLDERFVIWRAVFKQDDPLWNGFIKPPGKVWVDVYFEDAAPTKTQNDPLLSGGYYSKPFVHWDYDKKPWESASRTPAFEAVYDDLSMQQIFKNYLENLQLKVRPVMAALLSMKGKVKFDPDEIIWADTNDWNYLPKPIEQVGDIELQPETIKMIRENLGRHFHLELFRMFTDLAQTKNHEFRVLQLIEMAGERITQLLPTIETHEYYLAQVDTRARDIERQAGRGPFNRLEMENVYDVLEWALGREAKSVKIAPEFIGTLRQTQQMQQKLKPLKYGVGALAELADAMQDPHYVSRMLKSWEVGDETLSAVNFPQKLIKESEDYQAQLEAEQQMQSQREKFAQMIEFMKASGNVGKEIAPNSIAGQIAGAA
jgi:hypothetical protein